MAQTNFTPILLYASSTPTNVPSAGNLTNSANGSEIAINIADKNLFFKDNTNAVNTVPIRQSSTSSNGWLSSTDWNTFNNKSNTNGTVTSVAALTIGTTGTDLSSTVANGTTTPVITLQVPTASATNRGALSSADWSTFNSKAPGVTFTSNYVPYGQGTTTLNQSSSLQFNGTALSLGLAASAWSGFSAVQIGNGSSLWSSSSAGAQAAYYSNNLYYNGSNRIYINTGAATEYVQSSGIHYWYAAGSGSAGGTVSLTESMRIESGNLFVGATSAPQASKVFFTQTAADGYTLGLNAVSNGGVYYLVNFFAANTQTGTISSNGTTTTYATTSDYRLKTVVGSVADAGTRIDALQPIEYDWNKGGRTRGFLAHQFAEVYPSSVNGKKDAVDKDGKPIYQSMQASTPEVMADLIAEIQSLRKRIATLENKL
jgi:hypothetical protein